MNSLVNVIRSLTHEENITFINVYAPNHRLSKHQWKKNDRTMGGIRQIHTENCLVINRTTRQNISDIKDLNSAVNHLDLIDIYKLEYETAESVLFSNTHRMFKIDHTLGQQW